MTEEEQTSLIVKEEAQLVSRSNFGSIIPQNYDEACKMALNFCLAGIIPNGLKGNNDNETAGRVTVAIMQGLEVGLQPVAAINNVMVIGGRTALWGDGAMAVIQASGKVEAFKEWYEGNEGEDNWTAYTQIKKKGQEEPYVGTFSFAQAKKAKLTGKPGPWLTYPQRMLKMRARSFAMRDGFSEVLKGMAIVEEVQDMPVEKVEVTTDFLEE